MIAGSGVLQCKDGNVEGVQVEDLIIATDRVILAGGAWSNQYRDLIGIDIPIEPQKGQILHLDMRETTSSWPVVLGFHSHYMLTFPDHRVVVGATRETGSGYDTEVTVGGVQEVVNEALRIAPGLSRGRVVEVRVGLRPATPDLLPILGEVPSVKGLYLAAGHGANGLTAGAFSGIAVSRQVMDVEVGIDLEPYSIQRFEA